MRGTWGSVCTVVKEGRGGSEGGSSECVAWWGVSRVCQSWRGIGVKGEVAIGISGPCEGIGGVEVGGKGPAPGGKAGPGSCVIFGRLGRGRGRGRGGGSEALGVFWICCLGSFGFGFGFGLGLGLDCGFDGLRLSSSSSSSEVSSITSDGFCVRCRVLALSAMVPCMGAKSLIEVSAAFSFPGEVKRVS